MQENIQKVAWTIMLSAFFIFCLLAISIPLGIRRFVITATKSQPARVTAYGGAVLLNTAQDNVPTALKDTESNQEILEGTTLTTEPSSQAFIRLFDDSNLQVRNNSQVTILKSRVPRFESSPQPYTIAIQVQNGKVRVGVAPTHDRLRQFEVHTPHGLIRLEEGSYSINVTESETEVSVRTDRAAGQAILETSLASVQLRLGERGRMESGRPPQGPLPGERNLVINGDFQQPLSTGWSSWEERQKAEEAAGSDAIETTDGKQVIHFVRQGGNKQHAKNGIRQELELDVRDASSLEVRINVQVLNQSLSGGGVDSSEFPLMVLLHYRDTGGREHDWVRGFYYANREGLGIRDDEAYRGIRILQNSWYPFESENLMLSLGDQRPAHLISLSIYASGHDYESMASDVGIFVKE